MRLVTTVFCLAAAIAAASAERLDVSVLSGRADMVSGGNALVEISGIGRDSLQVQLNGLDVTGSFHPDASSARLIGRLSRLRAGKNMLEAQAGDRSARLELINHARTGPVFSGPHQQPFVCQTEQASWGSLLTPIAACRPARSTTTSPQTSSSRSSRETLVLGFPKGSSLSTPRPRVLQIWRARQLHKGAKRTSLSALKPERSTERSTRSRSCTILRAALPIRGTRPAQAGTVASYIASAEDVALAIVKARHLPPCKTSDRRRTGTRLRLLR